MSDLEAIVEVLDNHTQSARNQRCTCGWRPDWSAKYLNEMFPEYRQHREHVAQMLVDAGFTRA